MKKRDSYSQKALQIEKILDIFFSDWVIPEEEQNAVRQWLSESHFAELKDKSLYEKFSGIFHFNEKSIFAKELWSEIAKKIGMSTDLEKVMGRSPEELQTKRYEETSYSEAARNTPDTRTPLRERLSVKGTADRGTAVRETAVRGTAVRMAAVRVAAVILPAFIVISVFLLNNTTSAPVPVITQIVEDNIKAEETPLIALNLPQEMESPQVSAPVIAPQVKPILHETEPSTYDIAVKAPMGQHKYVVLPDNSSVIINGGGQMEFSSDLREAKLIGEAYFKVAKGNDTPFNVKAEYFSVHVTGTQFNVRCLPNTDESIVDLIEGSVEVSTGINRIPLKPDEQLMLEHATGIVKISASPEESWWMKPISFKSKSLPYILDYLSECYGISIRGHERITDNMEYTIKFDKLSSIERIMDMLSHVVPGFTYAKEPSGLVVSLNSEKHYNN